MADTLDKLIERLRALPVSPGALGAIETAINAGKEPAKKPAPAAAPKKQSKFASVMSKDED